MTRQNESWSMDFMSDQLISGDRFRLRTLVDHFSRESLAIVAGPRLTGDDVVEIRDWVKEERCSVPRMIRVDNDPEFISRLMDWWVNWNEVELDFSRPGKPTDHALIESINGRVREKCLNQHWFLSLEDAQCKLEAWRSDDIEHRPHGSLGDRTPREFAAAVLQGNLENRS